MHHARLRARRLVARPGRSACLTLSAALAIVLLTGLSSPAPAAAQEPEPEAPSAEEAPEPGPEDAAPAAEAPALPPTPDLAALIAQPDLDARTRLEMEILARVNGIRAEHGLPALVLDNRLVAAAREHAVDMAYRNHCRHTGTDGTRARDRMRRNGYPYNNWAGENILCGRKTAEAALGWWMGSPPHRRNLLHGHFTHIGVGVSMHGSWGPDMALVFAAGDSQTVEPDVFKSFREGWTADWIGATREPDRVR